MSETQNGETAIGGQRYRPGIVHRRDPARDPMPLVFGIPRSGRDYPNDFRSPAAFNDVKSSISMDVETLFDQAPEEGARHLEGYYWPYHNALAGIMRGSAGGAYHVSCHGMASIAHAVSSDSGAARSDQFCR